MITFVASDDRVAVPEIVQETSTTFAVYSSWGDFRSGVASLETHTFNGRGNYAAAETFFADWSKVCRDDGTWEVVECGPTPPPVVPATVSARQIRLWLISTGITLAQIDALIDAIEDPAQREYTRVEWAFAPYIERNHPMVATFAAALGLTAEQVDAGFIAAAGL